VVLVVVVQGGGAVVAVVPAGARHPVLRPGAVVVAFTVSVVVATAPAAVVALVRILAVVVGAEPVVGQQHLVDGLGTELVAPLRTVVEDALVEGLAPLEPRDGAAAVRPDVECGAQALDVSGGAVEATPDLL